MHNDIQTERRDVKMETRYGIRKKNLSANFFRFIRSTGLQKC